MYMLAVRWGSLCCEGMCSEASIVVPPQWAHDLVDMQPVEYNIVHVGRWTVTAVSSLFWFLVCPRWSWFSRFLLWRRERIWTYVGERGRRGREKRGREE